MDALTPHDALLAGFIEAIRHKDRLADELNALVKQTPIYQLMDGGNWFDAEKHQYDVAAENGDVCRAVYAAPPVPVAPQPMTAPDELAGDDYSAEARANWLYLKGKADG